MLTDSGIAQTVGGERHRERLLQPEGQRRGLGGVAVLRQHEELVATQPADRVAGPHLVEQPTGHLDEERVTDPVTERVVDHLEAVEVEEEERRARGEARVVQAVAGQGLLERLVDQRQHAAAVGQTGEVVVAGLPEQHLLAPHPLGDVGVADHQPAGGLHPRGLQAEPERRGAQAARVVVVEPAARVAVRQSADPRGEHRVVGRGEPHRHDRDVLVADPARLQTVRPEQLAVGPPRGVGRLDPAVLPDEDGRGRQRLEDGGELGDLGAAPLVETSPVVDVAEEDGDPVRCREGAQLDPAVGRVVAELEGPFGAVREHLGQPLLEDRAGQRREAVQQRPAHQAPGGAVQHPLGGGVEVGETPAPVEVADGVGDGGEKVGRRPLVVSVHLARSFSSGRSVVLGRRTAGRPWRCSTRHAPEPRRD